LRERARVRGDPDGTTLTSFLSLHRRERRQEGSGAGS